MANSDIVHIVGIDPNAVLLRPFAESSGRPDDFVLGADAPAALALLDREIAHLDARIEMPRRKLMRFAASLANARSERSCLKNTGACCELLTRMTTP
jgi:hypothetical protein